MGSFISGIGKFSIITIFSAMVLWISTKISMLVTIFPDYRINTLTISVIVFLAIIAIKRGIWH